MATEHRPLISEYKGKFPEIPEEILAQIIQENGDDIKACQKVLEEESRKYLYGCLPTESPVSVTKVLTVLTTKTTPGTNSSPVTSFVRSNSTGSGSSSGRSTPVNQILTPWVVPRYPSPISASSNPFNMLGNTAMVSNQKISPSEGYPPSNDNAQGTSPGAATSMYYQTSPNSGYSSANTSGGYFMRTITPTPGSHGPQPIMHPLMNGAQGTFQSSPYYTMPIANLGPADPRHHHMLPVGFSCDPGAVNSPSSVGTKIGTPYFVPMQSLVRPNLGQLYVRTNEPSGDESQYYVNTNPTQFNPPYQTSQASVSATVTSPSVSVPSTSSEATYLSPSVEFVPITIVGSPNTQNDSSIKTYIAGAHSAAVRQCSEDSFDSSTAGANAEAQQREANNEYLKACLSRQWKRFQNLEKECAIGKGTLELLIREISERDDDLYNQKYRVAPNPTDEQIHQLDEENNQLKKTIGEISKNVDRLDNGQDILPPANPQVYLSHRIPGPNHEGPVPFDRSNSVPYIPVKEQHPLQHQLSEQNLQYTLTPSSIEDWSMINAQFPPNPIPANNKDQQWHCSKCTFLNHESLLVCEMCSTNRTGSH